MTGKPDAWMPLYVGDWDSGTRHLTCEEDGAYFRLIRFYWKNGTLPDDAEKLSRIVGISLARWKRISPTIAAFFVVGHGRWTHRRADEEMQRAQTFKARASDRASRAASVRWGKRRDATSIAQAVLDDCPPPSPFIEEPPNRGSSHKRRERASSVLEAPPARAETHDENVVPFPKPDEPEFDARAAMKELAAALAVGKTIT